MTRSPSTSRRLDTDRQPAPVVTESAWRRIRPLLPVLLLVLVGGVVAAQDGSPESSETVPAATPEPAAAPAEDSVNLPTDPIGIMKRTARVNDQVCRNSSTTASNNTTCYFTFIPLTTIRAYDPFQVNTVDGFCSP